MLPLEGGLGAHTEFSGSVNSIPTSGADYAKRITACPTILKNLMTSLAFHRFLRLHTVLMLRTNQSYDWHRLTVISASRWARFGSTVSHKPFEYWGSQYTLINHSSPRRLAGEKNVPAIIIKQQFGFAISTT